MPGYMFLRDLAFTVKMRTRYLEPHLYRAYSWEGRYVIIDKSRCSTILQKRLAIDTILQKRDESICIEEKIERWPGYKRPNFFLETDSCTVPGLESLGWMHYAEADTLLYAFELETRDGLDVYLIPFEPLKAWFWQHHTAYRAHTMNQSNHTRGRLVPIRDVTQAITGIKHYIITDAGLRTVRKSRAA